MFLKPSKICYSQDSINNIFDKQCSHAGIRIGETLDDICDGRCSVHDIPTIKVVQRDNRWITCDNRRLWVFRHLERLGKCAEVPVRVTSYIPEAKMTSCNGGKDIEVRRGPGGRWHNKPSKRQAAVPKPKVTSANRKVYSSETPSTRTLHFNDPNPPINLNAIDSRNNNPTSHTNPDIDIFARSSSKTYGYDGVQSYNNYSSETILPITQQYRSNPVVPTACPPSTVSTSHAQEERNRRSLYGMHTTTQNRSTGYPTSQNAYGSDRSPANIRGGPFASKGMSGTSAMTSQPTSHSTVNRSSYASDYGRSSTRRQAPAPPNRIVDTDDISIHGTDHSVSVKSTSNLQRQKEARARNYETNACCGCTIL